MQGIATYWVTSKNNHNWSSELNDHKFNTKKLLEGQISFITAFTHGFFNIITESMVNAADTDNSDNSDSDDNNIYSKPKKTKKIPLS